MEIPAAALNRVTWRNRWPRYLRHIAHDSLNRQPLALFLYSRADGACLFILNHREHEHEPEQIADFWHLLTQKVSDLLELGR